MGALDCNKEGCSAECRVKDGGLEHRNGKVYLKQIFYCKRHGDRYARLYRNGEEPITEELK